MQKLSEKTKIILLMALLVLTAVNTVQLVCIWATKSYDGRGLAYATVKAFTPATPFSVAREQEEKLISDYVDKLMAINEEDETKLGKNGMGLAMGDPEKFVKPLYRCREFVKENFYKKYPTAAEIWRDSQFLTLRYEEVDEFIEWQKNTFFPGHKVLPDFMLEKLEFDRCVLIGIVRFKETHQREVFDWRQESRYGLSPTRKAAATAPS